MGKLILNDRDQPPDPLEEEKKLIDQILIDKMKMAALDLEIAAMRKEGNKDKPSPMPPVLSFSEQLAAEKKAIVKEQFGGTNIKMHTITRDASPEAHKMQIEDLRKDIRGE